MASFRVLHLSDLHIGNTYKHSEDIAYKIISDLGHTDKRDVKCVITTGDIFDGKSVVTDSLISEAVNFYEILLQEFNNNSPTPLNKEDFLFVPGNHDLVRDADEANRWDKYRRFLKAFYNEIPDWYNLNDFSVCREYPDQKIVFAGFNSCQLKKKQIFDEAYIRKLDQAIDADTMEKNNIHKDNLLNLLKGEAATEYDDYGYIPMRQLHEMNQRIGQLDDYLVVAFFHHHFYLLPEIYEKFGGDSLIRNYSEVVQQLKYMNVKAVLHGHKHYDLERPFITEDYYDSADSIIDVFAGGSVGTDRKDQHSFSIIDFYDRKNDVKFTQNKYVYRDEMLDEIKQKQIPPRHIADRKIRLLELLKVLQPDAYQNYEDCRNKMSQLHHTCEEITNWIGEALTGFRDVGTCLDRDYHNILFVLFAVQYRVLWYKAQVSKDKKDLKRFGKILNHYFECALATQDFRADHEKFLSMFEQKDLNVVAKACDELLDACTDRKTPIYLAFSMVGIFFADLYMVLTEYADDFKKSIEYKVNIKIEDQSFHENVPAPLIVIRSDPDRRSAYVELRCNDATAHKMAVLFVKEFDLTINKFEDYFKLIGLKLYYLLPKIDNGHEETLDNYNFEAYIPTLLPLLTGDNIYPSKVVFARELIQNSIDALAVREAKDPGDYSKTIQVELDVDENGRRYFKIRDHGTGMDRYKIERYFTSIGRSFYAGGEFEDLHITYKPISNFGIGFLSCFMVCREIDVKTKYYLPESESLKLHIPNYDGCFFIERDDSMDVGTEIKLYLDCELKDEEIIEYIQETMLDVLYPIEIVTKNKTIQIPSHAIRRRHLADQLFFVPFTENDVLSIDYKKEVLSVTFVEDYSYGLLIGNKFSNVNGDDSRVVEKTLNAGIAVRMAKWTKLFFLKWDSKYFHEFSNPKFMKYNSIFFNFPADWIQVDVSREKTSEFSDNIQCWGRYGLGTKIVNALLPQLRSFLTYAKTKKLQVTLNEYLEVINFCKTLLDPNKPNKMLNTLSFNIFACITEKEVKFSVLQNQKKKKKITYENENAEKMHKEFYKKNKENSKLDKKKKIANIDRFIVPHGLSASRRFRGKSPKEINQYKYEVYKLYAMMILSASQREIHEFEKNSSIELLEDLIFNLMYLGDVLNGKNTYIVPLEDIQTFNIMDGAPNIKNQYMEDIFEHIIDIKFNLDENEKD